MVGDYAGAVVGAALAGRGQPCASKTIVQKAGIAFRPEMIALRAMSTLVKGEYEDR